MSKYYRAHRCTLCSASTICNLIPVPGSLEEYLCVPYSCSNEFCRNVQRRGPEGNWALLDE